jgi:hypothetical protein
MSVTNRQGEVFGDLVVIDDLARPHADLGRRLRSIRRPGHAHRQCIQFGPRGGEQLLALVPTLLGQLRVVAGHQPFAGEVRR